MSNSKISALTSATTPLAGTETLPVVQSSTTKQVSVANLTAGRAVAAASLTATGTVGAAYLTSSGVVESTGANLGHAASRVIMSYEGGSNSYIQPYGTSSSVQGNLTVRCLSSDGSLSTTPFNFSYNANTFYQHIVQGVAGKGINFSANTPAAGMTSQIYAWYEEGTWTPNQGAGLTVVGAFSSSGKYTRNGRQITVIGKVNGATSIAVTASGAISTNLPFTSNVETIGIATNNNLNIVGGVYVGTATTVYATIAIGATTSIFFQLTYFI